MENENVRKRLADFIEYDVMVSNQDFAQKSGIDPSGLYKMLKGAQPISIKTCQKIADAWGLNIKWLTEGGRAATGCKARKSIG